MLQSNELKEFQDNHFEIFVYYQHKRMREEEKTPMQIFSGQRLLDAFMSKF